MDLVAGRNGSLPPFAGKLRNKADVAHFLLKDKKRREAGGQKYQETVGLSNILYSERFKESSKFFFRGEPGKGEKGFANCFV